MNKSRRKHLEKLTETIEEAKEALDVLLEEEQEYYDNMPESFQDSEKGESSYDAIDSMNSALSSLEDAVDYIREAIER